MPFLTLVIGNKNYSSWFPRPWLLLRQARILFQEVRIPLCLPESAVALAAWSPSAKVPALHDGDVRVRDSLAVCESLNERFPDKQLSSREAAARAVSAERHAGFAAAWVADAATEPERIERFEHDE